MSAERKESAARYDELRREIPALAPDDAHVRELADNVHPLDWRNPTPPSKPYDLAVVGAGTAGLVTAAAAVGLGARVALIERHLLGGDCLNVGCVPSKALLRSARAAADVRAAGGFGVRVPDGVEVDFAAVMERVRRVRTGLSAHDSVQRFTRLGVDVYLGSARFAGPRALEVDGRALAFSRAVIATGARPMLPPVPGLAQAGALTNETLFTLTRLPARLAVVGAGPIGCEIAQAFARFGAEVHVVEAGERVFSRADEDAAALVQAALVADGVRFRFGTELADVRRRGEEKLLALTHAGRTEELAVDEILVGVGRAPNVELGLEAAGVEYDERAGVHVDDFLRTTNARIYAAGDVCSRHKFTHVADAGARIVVQNALFSLGPFGRARVSALTIPWTMYTDPELAHVGLDEREARERGIALDTYRVELAEVDRAVLDGEGAGFLKVHTRRGTDRILGATLVARHAGEMISELTLAIVSGAGLRTLARTIHPYPTQAESMRRAGDAFNRTRLTAGAKRLLAALIALKR